MGENVTRRDFVKMAAAGAASVGMSQFLGGGSVYGADEASNLYNEIYRPQFHFSPKINWTNDPNGLVYYKGEYHLFFQHNPVGINWGNMTWGHAVSKDLMHWKQLEHAIEPDEFGTIYSGSAVVDWNNTSGFQTGKENVLVAFYTGAGKFAKPEKKFTQCLAYSNDRGRTWIKYDKNPIIEHIRAENRDPKVVWYEPTKEWVMALYLDHNDFILLTSKNLKEWTKIQDIKLTDSGECPDFFEMPVDGDKNNRKWVFWGGNGKYMVGSFDGKKFTSETEILNSVSGKYYAAQTWSDIPADDGRMLQIAWMRKSRFPGMPFNQQMSIPCELTLKTFSEGIRLCHNPVREIKNIRNQLYSFENVTLTEKDNPLDGIKGDLFEIKAEIELGNAREIRFMLRGNAMVYDVAKKTVKCREREMALTGVNGRVKLHILVDRASIEIFGNEGKTTLFHSIPIDPKHQALEVSATGSEVVARKLRVWTLKSTWR